MERSTKRVYEQETGRNDEMINSRFLRGKIMIYSMDYLYRKVLGDVHSTKEILHSSKDIWAFAYQEDERACNYKCKPVKGVIDDQIFYEYKRDGKGLKKNGVSIYSRLFADTYEEAVNGYNDLIGVRLNRLKNEVKKLEDMLIKEPKNDYGWKPYVGNK